MELMENSLQLTRRESGALADCLRGFEGMGRPSIYGRQPTEEDRDQAKVAAQEVYEMVSPIHNNVYFDAEAVIEVPRSELPKVERMLSRLLDNPMRAVDNICLEWAHDYNHHLRPEAYRRLGWVAEVQVALEQILMHPDDKDEYHNRRLQYAGNI